MLTFTSAACTARMFFRNDRTGGQPTACALDTTDEYELCYVKKYALHSIILMVVLVQI
jgi:hypothetical protein